MYVAGLERLLRQLADWSMFTTLCTSSAPSIESCAPGSVRVSTRRFHSALYRISLMSVLFPDPEAPVMATSMPRGISTSTFFRLFSRAPRTISDAPSPLRRLAGVAIHRLPERNWPVGEVLHAMIFDAVPCTTTVPPWTPGPG